MLKIVVFLPDFCMVLNQGPKYGSSVEVQVRFKAETLGRNDSL